MSALPRQPASGHAGLRLTAKEYLALGETAERYELVDGVVCMSPRPGSRHQAVLWLISYQLNEYCSVSGCRFFAEVDLVLDTRQVYAPDLMCFAPGRVAGYPQRLELTPDLVVEVLSPGNKAFDTSKKKDEYARFGVAEYWAVDPGSGCVRCFRCAADRLEEVVVGADRLASSALPGLVLDMRPLRTLAGE